MNLTPSTENVDNKFIAKYCSVAKIMYRVFVALSISHRLASSKKLCDEKLAVGGRRKNRLFRKVDAKTPQTYKKANPPHTQGIKR
jgi:hypothetical protein